MSSKFFGFHGEALKQHSFPTAVSPSQQPRPARIQKSENNPRIHVYSMRPSSSVVSLSIMVIMVAMVVMQFGTNKRHNSNRGVGRAHFINS